MTFSGRTALVTGASQGIGRACALRLAAAGASVAVAARNQEKLDELVQQIGSAGGKAAAFVTRRGGRRPDQSHLQSCARAVRQD